MLSIINTLLYSTYCHVVYSELIFFPELSILCRESSFYSELTII